MTDKCKQPYTFVPVVTGDIKTQDTPFHDGKQSNGRLTGSLQCTLTVKTPMIVGHFQYAAETLKNLLSDKRPQFEGKIIKEVDDHRVLPDGWEGCGYPQNGKYIVHKEKSILEPLFLDGVNSPVLISGSSLKGMVRQSIGAISNSPMERVKENQYSYRPGIVYSDKRRRSNYKLYEAIALEDLANKDEFKIKVIDQGYSGDGDITLSKNMVRAYWITKTTYDKKICPKNRTGDRCNDIDHFSIKKDDTVFIEYDTTNNKVTSFGNHEQYRWIYADTTTKIQKNSLDGHQPRPETSPHKDESVTEGEAKLTTVRSLFGYVDNGKIDIDSGGDQRTLHLGIGENDYSRMAGRISINTAVEVLKENDELKDRFIQLNKHNSFGIPLKILSSPKASAVECYIEQKQLSNSPRKQGLFYTYGDFSGFKKSGQPLSGRKFYYRWNPSQSDYTLKPDGENEGFANCIALASKQSTICRYISQPERQFKFTARFKDLSKAELGLLIASLSPHLSAEDGTKDYWQQLGHGRPLGLGSVEIQIDQIHLLTEEGALTPDLEDKTTYVEAFKSASELCNQANLQKWLKICQPQQGSKTYMTVKQHGTNRQNHIKSVRPN